MDVPTALLRTFGEESGCFGINVVSQVSSALASLVEAPRQFVKLDVDGTGRRRRSSWKAAFYNVASR